MSRIYIETTIPSFYYKVRTDATMVARRQWTRKWFDAAISTDEIVTSPAVLDELEFERICSGLRYIGVGSACVGHAA